MGEYVQAGISVVSLIPYIGDLAKAGKIPKFARVIGKVITRVAQDAQFAERATPILKKIHTAIGTILDSPRLRKCLPEGVYDQLKSIRSKLDDLFAPKRGLRARMGDPPSGMIKPQAHHDLPQADRFQPHWNRAGLDIDDPAFGRWVEGGPVGDHQKWSKTFNDEWDAFFDQFPAATRDQILDQMNKLRIDPRFQ